jgi:hypothetical protein
MSCYEHDNISSNLIHVRSSQATFSIYYILGQLNNIVRL